MSPRIRLRYSMIVNYTSMLYKMTASLIFTIILTRKLTIEAYGSWGVIFSIASLLITPVSLWGFWVSRYYSRGYSGAGKTGFYLTIIYDIISFTLIVLIGVFSEDFLNISSYYFYIATLLAILYPIMFYFTLIARVAKPELLGYSNFIYETIRVILVYYFLVILRYKLEYVIFSVELAMAVTSIYLFYNLYNLGVFDGYFVEKLAIAWIKLSYVPGLSILSNALRNGIRFFLAIVTGSTEIVSYYSVAFTVDAPLTKTAAAITPAIYARLLRGNKCSRDVEESISMIIVFTMFIAATLFSIPHAILAIFGSKYIKISLFFQLAIIYALFQSFTSLFENILLGVEEVDSNHIPGITEVLKSMLVKVPSCKLFSLFLVYVTIFSSWNYYKDIYLVLNSAIVTMILLQLVLLASFAIRSRSIIRYKIPVDPLIPALITAAALYVFYKIFEVDKILYIHFWDQIKALSIYVGLGAVLYVVLLYVISPWMKMFVKKSISYMISRVSGGIG